jgi:hypothetical protein
MKSISDRCRLPIVGVVSQLCYANTTTEVFSAKSTDQREQKHGGA